MLSVLSSMANIKVLSCFISSSLITYGEASTISSITMASARRTITARFDRPFTPLFSKRKTAAAGIASSARSGVSKLMPRICSAVIPATPSVYSRTTL